MTPEEARELLDWALHDPVMRELDERDPPPPMTPEQTARLRRLFTSAPPAPAEEDRAPRGSLRSRHAITTGMGEAELAEARQIADRLDAMEPPATEAPVTAEEDRPA